MKKYFLWMLLSLVMGLMAVNSADAKKPELEPAEVIVGLGYGPARNKKGEPRDELKRRVDKAVEVYKQGLAPYIIFTGADTGAGCEAEVMKELAVKQGVLPDRIITETRATDTITNAKYSVEIMRSKGWSSAILVSNPYHLKRARSLFEASPGIKVQTAPCATPANPFYHLFGFSYEVLARAQNFIINGNQKARADENPKDDH